jgi:hypothetical protein
MIYELEASGLLSFPDPFAWLPPAWLGLALWLVCTAVAIAQAIGGRGRGTALLAAGIYTGLFVNLYSLVDEVMINLEHAWNLFHYGRFSMSPEGMVDGTVELVYYLLHAPFAGSHQSLIAANFAISFLVGLAHLWFVNRMIDPAAGAAARVVQLCGFALCAPLAVIFSSGFGNGLVSLGFLAAMNAAVNRREAQSLLWSSVLPLLRPDAVLLSVANMGVLAVRRRLTKQHLPLLLVPLAAMAIYYAGYREMFGHWVPTPVRFKSLHISMLAMTSFARLGFEFAFFLVQPAHAIGVWMMVMLARRWRAEGFEGLGWRPAYLLLYAAATLPMLLFYSFTHSTIGDFSFSTYSRYWVAFDVALALLMLAMLTERYAEAWTLRRRGRGEWVAALLLWAVLVQGMAATRTARGRADGVFAGSFTQRFVPAGMSVATSEMNTFGLMLERPVGDLWGYTTPAIAFSSRCNGDKIRNNPDWFLTAKPDLYWPYWFTQGLVEEAEFGRFDRVETALATFHHTGRRGNLLGDMRRVLAEYDVVIIRAGRQAHGPDQLAYLVRKQSREALFGELLGRGFRVARERAIDWREFEQLYNAKPAVWFRCG